jgi:surfeit locus 1 family protein
MSEAMVKHTLPGRANSRLLAGGWALLAAMVSRRWWWKTLLVLAAMAVCLRLAVWQVDRLRQRQAQNAEMRQLLSLPPLDLNVATLPADPAMLKYRQATAHGRYDFSRQIALEPQNWSGAPGLHLLTPLILDGGQRAVLVDRGWLPAQNLALETWPLFDRPGPVGVLGTMQMPQKLPGSAGAGPQQRWYRVDLAAIQAQMPYDLLPIYLVESPGVEGNASLPYRQEPQVDLSDGPHLNYVIQWLSFALILGGGYVWLLYNLSHRDQDQQSQGES